MLWFLVIMYGCESWALKKAECLRIDVFQLWFWRRLLRAHWIARSSNQSIQKEINPEYSLERLMLKLQYFVHLIQRADSLEKTLLPGRIEGGGEGDNRGGDGWMNGITDSMDISLSKLQEIVRTGKLGVLQSMRSWKVRHNLVTEQQQLQ